ncbi:hypothetical protein HPULCUR_002706 [Helicostylum pulchrum]|uniref:Uncharacterized protein n=1 Tax=Helicostylum pulchrum TaxID=562976 RepID=A0ABP9XRB6_9FUNG
MNSHSRPSTMVDEEEMYIDSSETNEGGLTQEEIQMNALATRKRPRIESSPLPLSAPSPKAPILERPDCALEIDGRPILKFEQVTPGPPSIARKSMSRALKEDESERIDAKDMLAAAPASSVPASPMAFDSPSAADSPIQRDHSYSPSPSPSEPPAIIRPTKKPKLKKPKQKAKSGTEIGISTPSSSAGTATTTAKPKKKVNKPKSSGGTSIGIGIPGTSSGSTAITVGVPGPSTANNEEEEEDDEMGTGRPGSKKRKGPKIHDFRLPENLRTLDDIKEDPVDVEALEKPMALFTKDIDGIVSKNFKEMEIIRYESLRKLERAAKMSPEELAAMKKKELEEAEEASKKKKIAKQKDEERRRKEADGHVLAES